MKLLSSDLLAVGLSVLITGGSTGLLYQDFTKKIDAGENIQIGTISFKKRVAQRKYAKQVVWEDIEQNSPVFSNDSIRTSNISEAVINLDDGTAINIDENSLILLAAAKNAININFEQGSISATRSGIGETSFGKINIQSKNTIVSIEKSDVTLSKTETDELDLTVSSGTALLKAGGGAEKTILKDQNVMVNAGASETRITEHSLKLITPSESEYIITSGARGGLSFTWKSEAANKPVIEVSADRAFARPLLTRANAASGFSSDFLPGTYFWRIKAYNPVSKKMEFSEIRKFAVIKDRPVTPVYPPDSGKVSYSSILPLINFRWTGNDLASSYIIEVSGDSEFKQIVKSSQTRLTGISFDKLSDGTYYWRVRTRVSIPGNENYSTQTRPFMFQVEKLKVMVPVQLISPLPDIALDRNFISARGAVFSWKHDSSAMKYELQFSSDKNFSTTDFTAQSKTNFINVKREFKPGSYYWRVKIFSVSDGTSVVSAPRQIQFIDAVDLGLANPPDKTDFTLEDGIFNLNIDFAWNLIPLEGYYLFELARDKNMVNLVKRAALNSSSTSVKSLNEGLYFWRVRYLDTEKNVVTSSPVYSFFVSPFVKALQVPDPGGPAVASTPAVVETKKPLDSTRILVHTPVRRASILINNRHKGYGRVEIDADSSRTYDILIRAQGYEDFSVQVTPEKNKVSEIKPVLVQTLRLARVKWRSNVMSSIITDTSIYDNNLYFGTADSRLVKTDLNGTIIWTASLEAILKSEPGFTAETVYVGDVLSNLYSISLKDGSVRWKKKTEGPLLFGARPVIYKSNVCVAASSGILQVFSESGEELWKNDLEAGIFSGVTLHDDIIYVPTDQNMVLAVYASDGDNRWRFRVRDRIVACPPTYYKNKIYVGDMSGTFYMIDARKGREIKRIDLGSAIQGAPYLHQEMLILSTSKGRVVALKASDLSELWRFSLSSNEKLNANHDRSGSEIIFSTSSKVYARDILTGKAVWESETGAKINTGVKVKEDNIFVGLSSGELVSLRPDVTIRVQQ